MVARAGMVVRGGGLMALARFPSCRTCDDCDDLLTEIRKRMYNDDTANGPKGVLTRWVEQVYGCIGPDNTMHPSCAGRPKVGTWEGHNQQLQDQQERLKRATQDYDDNDCGDTVSDPNARQTMREARRMAYSKAIPVRAGDYKGPPRPANPQLPRTVSQMAGDAGRAVCVGGLTGAGAVGGGAVGAVGGFAREAPAGALAGGAAGAAGGALYGGSGGTLVVPGVGTVAGAGSGAVVGGAGGAVLGGIYTGVPGAVEGASDLGARGAAAGRRLGGWLCN